MHLLAIKLGLLVCCTIVIRSAAAAVPPPQLGDLHLTPLIQIQIFTKLI